MRSKVGAIAEVDANAGPVDLCCLILTGMLLKTLLHKRSIKHPYADVRAEAPK